MEWITDWFTWQTALSIGGVILAALATSYFKNNAIVKELDELGKAVYQALDEKSPGGKQITKAEKQKIMKEAIDIPIAIIKSRLKFWKFWK